MAVLKKKHGQGALLLFNEEKLLLFFDYPRHRIPTNPRFHRRRPTTIGV